MLCILRVLITYVEAEKDHGKMEPDEAKPISHKLFPIIGVCPCAKIWVFNIVGNLIINFLAFHVKAIICGVSRLWIFFKFGLFFDSVEIFWFAGGEDGWDDGHDGKEAADDDMEETGVDVISFWDGDTVEGIALASDGGKGVSVEVVKYEKNEEDWDDGGASVEFEKSEDDEDNEEDDADDEIDLVVDAICLLGIGVWCVG